MKTVSEVQSEHPNQTTWRCRRVPNRTKKRVFNRCDAARIAAKATAVDFKDDIIEQVAKRLGYSLIGYVDNDEQPPNDMITEYLNKLNELITLMIRLIEPIERYTASLVDWHQIVFSQIPDFLLDDDASESIIIRLLKGLARKVVLLLDYLLEFAELIRAKNQELNERLNETLENLQNLRNLLDNANAARNVKIVNLDYVIPCKS